MSPYLVLRAHDRYSLQQILLGVHGNGLTVRGLLNVNSDMRRADCYVASNHDAGDSRLHCYRDFLSQGLRARLPLDVNGAGHEALCDLERYVRLTLLVRLWARLTLSSSYYTHPNEPGVDYPEGFQGTEIPVYAPTVVQVIEERIAGLHPV